MLVQVLLLLCSAACVASVHFGHVEVLGRVRSREPDEISGLGASRLHPGVLYGLNDHGDTNRIFAMDPVSGEVKATLTIANVNNNDWEDICVGTCGSDLNGWCIYIGEIGDHNHDAPRKVYKVHEPAVLQDATLHVVDTYTFTWGEDDAESLMIDPKGDLYVISKVHRGNALFARLPPSGWGSSTPVTIPTHDTARLGLHTDHNDPQGADISPNGRALVVKTEEGLLYYPISPNMNYASEVAGMRHQDVSTYVRRKSGESVAWNVNGTGFYTLPEGLHSVFNYYTVTGEPGSVVG